MPQQSSTSHAYRVVRERILAGDYPGGSLISENAIAAELGMSRTPVRSAFQRLKSEGWLTLYPRRGAVVTPSSPREAVEVLEARHLIEVHAVQTTTPEARAQLKPQLDHLLELQREAAERDDGASYATHDAAFHNAIVAAAGNTVLLNFYSLLRDRQRRMTVHALRRAGGAYHAMSQDHQRLAEHAARGDAAAYAAELRAHLSGTHGISFDAAALPAHSFLEGTEQ